MTELSNFDSRVLKASEKHLSDVKLSSERAKGTNALLLTRLIGRIGLGDFFV
jgi:hypothetical protein